MHIWSSTCLLPCFVPSLMHNWYVGSVVYMIPILLAYIYIWSVYMALFYFHYPYTDIWLSLCTALILFPDLVDIRVYGLCLMPYYAPWFHAYIHDLCALLYSIFSFIHVYDCASTMFSLEYDRCLFHDFYAILNHVCPVVNLTIHICSHRVLCPYAYAHLLNMTFHDLWICFLLFILIISMLPCALLSWYPAYWPWLLSMPTAYTYYLYASLCILELISVSIVHSSVHTHCPCLQSMLVVSMHSCVFLSRYSYAYCPYIFIFIFF